MDAIVSLSAWELQVIVSVARHRTLTATASSMKASQSSLSRAISRLEKNLNVVLFERSTRRMQLTPSGQKFVVVAERVLNDLQFAYTNMREAACEERGQVLITTFPQFAREALPPIVAAYRQNRTHTEIHVRTGRNPEIVADVSSGLADFGITLGDDITPKALDSIKFRRDALCALIPANHPLGKTTSPLSFAKLDNEVMVSLPHETCAQKRIEGAAATGRITLNHAVIVPDYLEQIAHSRAGVGISIVPSSLLPAPSPHLTIRPLRDPQLSVWMTLLSLKGRRLSPAAISFRETIIGAIRSATKAQEAANCS